VGINYHSLKSGHLNGCLNDVKNIKEFVVKKFNFPTDEAHMRTLTDDQSGAGSPTKANIVAAMKWLVEGAKDGDSLFFHYSGHGAYAVDKVSLFC
jgi:hypothetical protein